MTSENLKSISVNKLPKIALIVDVENWAFHNYAKQISRRLSNLFEFQIYFYGQYEHIEDLMLEVKDFDLIHFFWRGVLFGFLNDKVMSFFTKKKESYKDFVNNVLAKSIITTSVYDHLYLSAKEIREQSVLYNALAVGYTTCSEKLDSIYSSIPEYPSPSCVIENGVDLEFFKPVNPERFYGEKEEIIIGWAGNSKWGQDVDGIDHKGLETIIKPAIESLRQAGYNVRGYFADRQERWIPHGEMNDYYNSIDIYVCASETEGSPDPVLESMACGIPVISTDVGIVPELFGHLQQEYILPSRDIEQLKIKLLNLITNPEKRKLLSIENLEGIKKRGWEKQSVKWHNFFHSIILDSKNESSRKSNNRLRKQNLELYQVKRELRISQNALNKSRSDLNNSKKRAAELEKWTVELQTVWENSQNRVAELDKWTTELETALRKSENLIARFEKQIEELNQSAVISQAENKKLKTELAAAKDLIEMMEASKFWKLRTQTIKLKELLQNKKEK